MRPSTQRHKRKLGSEMLQHNAIRRETCGVPNCRATPWLFAESINRGCDAFWKSRGIDPRFVY